MLFEMIKFSLMIYITVRCKKKVKFSKVKKKLHYYLCKILYLLNNSAVSFFEKEVIIVVDAVACETSANCDAIITTEFTCFNASRKLATAVGCRVTSADFFFSEIKSRRTAARFDER